jgi:AcrR family transcriptional regulator
MPPDPSRDTREQILRAALQAFAEKGFDGATTRDIAKSAGVNHGLIQYYFGGKPSLWRAAVDRAFAELESGLDSVASDPALSEGRERIGALVRRLVRYVARNPEFVRMMHEEGKRRGPRMRWLVDRHARRLYEAVSSLIERAQACGDVPAGIDPLHFYYILAGSIIIFHQAAECKQLTGVDPCTDEVAEKHAEAVERMLLGPPRP